MRDEDGFTLVEMVIAIMVFGLVISTTAIAMVVMFRTTDETTQRLSESPDLQIAAAYFGSDVQSAQRFTGTCGPAGLLTMSWTDPGNAPAAGADDSTRTVTYAVTTEGTQDNLVRHSCVGSGGAETTTLVDFLKPSATPVVECSPTPCNDATTKTVRVHGIFVCMADASLVCKDDPLEFELKAKRRTVA